MFSGKQQGDMRNKQGFVAKRRQLLRAGLSGAVVALGVAGTRSLAGPLTPQPDFGPDYSVQDVYRVGPYTHVELGFRVNGLPFTTQLRSTDGSTWRPL